jgi:Ras-related protein Rab-1A
MEDDEYDYIFKVLLLGNSDVGKSSLLLRFVDSLWNDAFVPTIGVDFKVKTLEINNKKVKMQIWDTAGQERFRTVVSTYFRGAHGILLLYDVTNKDSFKNLENWLIEIEKNSSDKVLKILVGNKCDLSDDREIQTEEGQAFAVRNGMEFMETSAKMNTNVSEAFETLGKLMIEFNSKGNNNSQSGEGKNLKANSGKDLNTKKKCC